jgi:hypothetical protein
VTGRDIPEAGCAYQSSGPIRELHPGDTALRHQKFSVSTYGMMLRVQTGIRHVYILFQIFFGTPMLHVDIPVPSSVPSSIAIHSIISASINRNVPQKHASRDPPFRPHFLTRKIHAAPRWRPRRRRRCSQRRKIPGLERGCHRRHCVGMFPRTWDCRLSLFEVFA